MECPRCGMSVPKRAATCPYCGEPLRPGSSAGTPRPAVEGPRYCPTCGTLVPEGRESCPHCGMPLPAKRGRHEAAPGEAADISQRPTSFLPRMMSAIPTYTVAESEGPGRPRTTVAFIVAAVCAVVVFGALFLSIAHPWDPGLLDTRAQVPADTSMEGFPGTVERLQGQDVSGAQGTATDGGVAASDASQGLGGALTSLNGYADELTAEYGLLEQDFGASDDVRSRDAAAARQTSIAISNLIDDLQGLDVTTDELLGEQRTLVRMGNYLRNRADALTGAWDQALASPDPEADRLRVLDAAWAEDERYGDLYEDAARGLGLSQSGG